MLEILSNIFSAFILGLLTPTTAVCILPLYPGFLVYLANSAKKLSGDKKTEKKFIALFGLLITSGVIAFMLLLGLIFTIILEISLTKVIEIVSPAAFMFLAIISIFLIFDMDAGKFIPKFQAPKAKNPWVKGFLFGFFFGAIVIPCNPLFIAAFFTQATFGGADFVIGMLSFLFFGIGIGFPLIILSLISSTASKSIIGFLIRHKKKINLFAGILMLGISLYYLYNFRVIIFP